jgi:hypothetical protein
VCKYFLDKYSEKLSENGSFDYTNGTFLRWLRESKGVTGAYANVHSRIGFDVAIDSNNVVDFIYKMFEKFSEINFDTANIHLNKDNNPIFDFVALILQKKLFVNAFTVDKLGLFHVIYSKLMLPFRAPSNYALLAANSDPTSVRFDENLMKSTKLERITKYDDFKQCWYLINKHLRYLHHKSIFQLHKNKNTTPKSLFYSAFPRPFFEDDDSFIGSYNKIIEKTQLEIMDLIEEALENKINGIAGDLRVLKEKNNIKNIIDSESIDIEQVFKFIENRVQSDLKEYIEVSKNKAERCRRVPFEKKSFGRKKTNNESNTPRPSVPRSNDRSSHNRVRSRLNSRSRSRSYSRSRSRSTSRSHSASRSISRSYSHQKIRPISRHESNFRSNSRHRSRPRLSHHNEHYKSTSEHRYDSRDRYYSDLVSEERDRNSRYGSRNKSNSRSEHGNDSSGRDSTNDRNQKNSRDHHSRSYNRRR